MIRGLITAIRTLSILPVSGKDAEDAAFSLSWFPLVGCLLGLILYGLYLFLNWISNGSWPEGIAITIVLGGILLTRGLHLDGLADWADAFGSISDKEEKLKIMKDSHIGAFGVLMLIAILITKWIALIRLVVYDKMILLVVAYVISRTVMVELAVWLPYARLEGGTAASFVNNARFQHRLWAWLSACSLSFVFCGLAGIVALFGGWFLCRAFGTWCYHRIGGVTGDLLGACSEITETLILFLGAVAGERLTEYMDWKILL